jgi:hypothetical protein
MNPLVKGASLSTDDAIDKSVERILGNAKARPAPSAEEAQVVRDNVQAEWQALIRKRTTNRRLVSWAIAASILVVVFVGLNTIRLGGISEVQVADIDKSFGSIYMLGDNSELLESNFVHAVTAGQTIITDKDSGIGFAWAGGGSLRIDESTRVEFLSRDAIYLRTGRIYFDSKPVLTATAASAEAKLTIITDHGEVTHVGTQYMASAQGNTLTVSVREGEIRLERPTSVESALGGQQIQIQGGATVNIVKISPYGENWQWIEPMAPAANVDGRSVHEFLDWVSHETGLKLQFANDNIESRAKNEVLVGTVDTDPTSALRIWMLGSDLDWRITSGKIFVGGEAGDRNQGTGNQH